MKKHILFLIILALFSCVQDIDNSGTQSQSYIGGLDENDKKQFTEKDIPVTQGKDGNTVKLRFYEDMGDVPYISVSDYHKMMTGESMSVKKTNYGEYKLTNSNGSAIVNTKKETFFSNDYLAFTNMMGLYQKDMANVYYDGMPYCRFKSVEITPETAPLTLNYADCSIDIRGDDNAVYFPLATINDLYSDLSYNKCCFNGEKIIVTYSAFYSDPANIDPDYYKPILKETRSAEMAAFSYNNLCFSLQHYYGYPGGAKIGNMKELGLDAALLSHGQEGRIVKELLTSTNMTEYMAGTIMLQYYFGLDSHHSNLMIAKDKQEDKTYTEQIIAIRDEKLAQCAELTSLRNEMIKFQDDYRYIYYYNMYSRTEKYGSSDTYHTSGNTAICLLDTFTPTAKNLEAWKAFYNGNAEMPVLEDYPNDPVLVLVDSIGKAKSDPNIENLVIDISLNVGGSVDAVMFVTSLLMNKTKVYTKNTLTGQTITTTYEIDRNLDGKFDASDDVVLHNLNIAILESRIAYSCGNLFPAIMKDEGYPILGET
ncbi:MAG: hypothetical protein J6Y01_09780, partial [Spirochaetales bacterium]|nr:hypothetical protein [Spirochaetales bacterium]